MSTIKDFNFYTFLQDITNQSLDPLQGNEKFNDLVKGMESVFNKLYRRVQEIGILNTLDLSSDRDFVKYLPDNEKTVQLLPEPVTAPYKDLILEQLSLYLDTDHFKDTVAMMMRLWQQRDTNGGLIGPNGEDIGTFIEEHIIPAFKFFTMNAGDLHKSKGVKVLLERLFEFYGQVDEADQSFDGVEEHDDADLRGRRFRKFTSLREGITLGSLLKNYANIQIFQNVNFKITHYVELETHRFVVAENYLFISRKDREDWHIINIVDDIYRLNKYYLVIRQYKTLLVYSDRIDLYDSTTQEFILPEVDPNINVTNVEFVPKVMNIEDKFNQYHDNNVYFVDRYLKPGGGFGCFQHNLKRIRHRTEFDTLVVETLKIDMGITYLDLLYLPLGVYPRAIEISSVDYLWLNFYDAATTETFEFYPNVLVPASLSPVKFAYSFIMEEQTKVVDPALPSGFNYPVGKFVCVTRDGYDYDHATKGFAYSVLSYIENDLVNKYIVQERVVSNFLQTELDKIIGDDVQALTVFDFFIPQRKIVYQSYIYTDKGFWDANNSTKSSPSLIPAAGDYWIVSNAGNIELNGITNWSYGDVIVWNDKFKYWEKNNEIKTLVSGENTSNIIDHRLIVVGTKEFLNDEGDISSPYERSCGLFEIQLSSFELNITNFSKLFWIDTNPVEKFGEDPNVLFSYVDKTTGRYFIYSVRMDGFFREHDQADMSRVLKSFPVVSAMPVIYKIEITDKHLIAYCEKFLKVPDSKSTAIICEDTNYNLPFGIRSNRMNVAYDADIRLTTRARQPYYREWTIVDGNQVTVTGEEVEAFKNTLERYAPLNTENEFLQENIDAGISTQGLEVGTEVEDFQIEIPDYGPRAIKEISKLAMRDLLEMRTDGDPDYPNCDCVLQRQILYLHDFEPMTLFYDFSTMSMNPGLSGVPSCVPADKLGKTADKYSSYEEVCRFDTGYFYYQYDDGVTTIPRLVRSRFRVNLFDRIQRVAVVGAFAPLIFNWSVHCLIEVFEDNPLTTMPEWITATDEEIFMPLKINAECISIGIYYTTDNTVPPDTIVDPWDIYDIKAMEVSNVYNCNFVPWVPDFNQFLRYTSPYPALPIVLEVPPVRI